MKRRKNSGMWDYLDASGVLENGNELQIKAVKREYRKKYFLEHKRHQRTINPEYTIHFSKKNGDFETVTHAAKKHKMSITAFIHSAALAYIQKIYVVPDKLQIAKLEQILSDCLNEVQTIVRQKEKYAWERERKFEAIEKRIEKLETQINDVFRNPPILP